MLCGFEFYRSTRSIFASDCPFDPEKGTLYIRETIRILDEIDMPKEDREKIYYMQPGEGSRQEVREIARFRPPA